MRAPLARSVRVPESRIGETGARRELERCVSTTDGRGSVRRRLGFGPTASGERTGGQFPPAPPVPRGGGGVGQRCVTPRQTCPRPKGLGRNLRSKTRWFTGFCNSHQVSHFATFFIDARAEISVAESRYRYSERRRRVPGHRERALSLDFLGAVRAGGSLCAPGERDGSRTRGDARGSGREARPPGSVTSSRVVLLSQWFRQ